MKQDPFDGPVLFPKFIRQPRARTLAFWQLGRVYTLEQAWDCFAFADVLELLFQENLLLFVKSLFDLPEAWLETCIEAGDVFSTEDGTPRACRVQGPRSTTRWIVQSDAWGHTAPSLAMLEELSAVLARARVGTPTTPGALGITLLKESWREQFGDAWPAHRHQRPPEGVCLWLSETCTGARADFDPSHAGTLIPTLHTIDRKNAYGAAFQEVPSGPSTRFYGGHTGSFATYYATVTCRLRSALAYGLFPVRTAATGSAETVYPTQPGDYQTHLWKEEIEFLQARGIDITLAGGEGWREMTTDTASFVATMEQLRDAAPPALAVYFKRALVAAIGRLGMPSVSHRLSLEETETRVAFDGRATDYFVQQTIEKRPESMPHWFYYVLMKCRLALTQEAESWKQQELLLGTNTDAVFLEAHADTSSYTEEEQKADAPSGTWIVSTHTNVRLPASRHFVSDQKVALPGIPHERRAAYIATLSEDDAPY
jgi:hypothetical protein